MGKNKNKKTGNLLYDAKTGNPQVRVLNSTTKELKIIQKRICKFLSQNISLPDYCYGGVPKRDNLINAKRHQGNK